MKQVTPRVYRGFRDIFSADIMARNRMIDTIRSVYESYGFVPLETPAIEYVDVLGKFLPEAGVADEGIFAFRNEDDEWIALRYDLTAPLSRVVSQYNELPRPFRRYQVGPVWRMEKPGPGRFREFYQFDFDTVGAAGMATDAEACCIMCDTLETLGIPRGDYLIKMNNRKILNGILENTGLSDMDKKITWRLPSGDTASKQVTALDVLRSIDKLDKVGRDGVAQLLTSGRMDPSGDFTPGLDLPPEAVNTILGYLDIPAGERAETLERMAVPVGQSANGLEGIAEMREIDALLTTLGYGSDRVVFDPTIVRGLSYYTGPVFEGVLTFDIVDETGVSRSFGSVFGGGRYDDLVERFTGQKVPATGASIGVDRLLSALRIIGKLDNRQATAAVLVVVMDRSLTPELAKVASTLRREGINTELYQGAGGIKAQLKYADKCGIPVAVIIGSDEIQNGTAQIKNLYLGRELSKDVAERETWRKERPAQEQVALASLAESVKAVLKDVEGSWM